MSKKKAVKYSRKQTVRSEKIATIVFYGMIGWMALRLVIK